MVQRHRQKGHRGGRQANPLYSHDDGDAKWHNLADELWLELGKESAPAPKASSSGKSKSARTSTVAIAMRPAPRDSKASKKKKSSPGKKLATEEERAAVRAAMAAAVSGPLDPNLPRLVDVQSENIDVFPCGVIRVRNAVPYAARQRLWDTVMCAGFDFREVAAAANNGSNRNGANMWYTQAAGAPDILLHYNYYEPPSADQPPPMALLCAADAVFKGAAKLDRVRDVAVDPNDVEEGEEGEETEDKQEDGGSDNGGAAAKAPWVGVHPARWRHWRRPRAAPRARPRRARPSRRRRPQGTRRRLHAVRRRPRRRLSASLSTIHPAEGAAQVALPPTRRRARGWTLRLQSRVRTPRL